MKAIVCTKFGPPDALKLEEIQKPTPGDDEVLVKVHAATITYSNLKRHSSPCRLPNTSGYRSIFDYKRALSPKGIYVSTGGSMAQIFQGLLLGPLISMAGKKKLGGMVVKPNKDLGFMKELIEAGKVKPVIDRRYPISNVAEAFQYYGEGNARGKVVITVEHNNKT